MNIKQKQNAKNAKNARNNHQIILNGSVRPNQSAFNIKHPLSLYYHSTIEYL